MSVFAAVSTPPLGANQRPFQCTSVVLSIGLKQPAREDDRATPYQGEECVAFYLVILMHFPIRALS
jgi:hypothetical protein